MPDSVDTQSTGSGPLTAEEHRALLAEIAAEVKARRASGALPVSVERELAGVFAANSPVGTADDEPEHLLRRAEAAAHIDPLAPTASGIPGGSQAKLVLRRAIGWCLGWLAGQTTAFNGIIARLLRVLDERITQLEGVVGEPDATLGNRVAGRAEDRLAAAHDTVVRALADAPLPDGRILVARGGGGVLCEALVSRGVDAYLVEADADASFDAAATGLDARPGTTLEHLVALPADTLAGAVLIGDPDEATSTAKVSIVTQACRVLVPGGSLVIVGTDPAGWGTGPSAAAADLAPGRPWQTATWTAVLGELGVAVDVVDVPAGTTVLVGRTPGS